MHFPSVRVAVAGTCLLLALAATAGVYSIAASAGKRASIAVTLTGGDPKRAPALLIRYGCAACHVIPGIPGADGLAGPPLISMRQRVYVGGVLGNTAENLVSWIANPRAANPRTAMPVTGIDEREARDVAAYLYSF